ncbi:GntP family permease [Clostridium cellulovorans]|uniref:Gluconate transporter n=1 Tax=Clostridium cellulovorans (strain ATCC 35296 / DSM 3052 / OCM 3 / 743B) TaxID=573061 RepID=D9SNG3_CLOC7|nr:SLC13 family permease [Clostridium cellulovorans]ADL53955.1 Gluconate transporter [Clostridium cellulovorans 743B]
MPTLNWIGAMIGLIVAVILILKKITPVYALITGAILGGLAGGASLSQTVSIIISGTSSVMGAVVHVISAGVLAGILIESGAAEKISETIVERLGERRVLLAIALATMIMTSVGVFNTVAIIIVAPIAMSVGKRIGITKSAILFTMIGGGKAGNMISPNPNTIAAAQGFNLDLASVMIAGFIPAVVGLIVTYIIARFINSKCVHVQEVEWEYRSVNTRNKPSFAKSMVAPITAILLLAINPIGNILNIKTFMEFYVDSIIILPSAALIGLLAMGQVKEVVSYTTSGLDRMTSTVIILIGAGAIAGVVSNSNLSDVIVDGVKLIGIPGTFLAPIVGILMGATMASTSIGTIVATSTFGKAILSTGVAPLNAAVMLHTGATVIDHLPHGNFFHVTRESVKMEIKDRLKIIPYESIVGGVMCLVATILYGLLR